MSPFSTINDALAVLKKGGMVIVVDDESRENEGDLVVAAEYVTEEQMAFIIHHTGGVVCLSLSDEIADTLALPPMVNNNTSKYGTAFTVSIEAAHGITTGISAADRVTTIRAAIDVHAKPEDLTRPGHVFPLRANKGGVLARAGHTEASVDLCRIAGLRPGAVISELMHENGTMMRLPELEAFAATHDLPIVSIVDLIAFRHSNEHLIEKEAETILETETGDWKLIVYRDTLHTIEHIALVKGSIDPEKPTLVRVHSECFTGDVLRSHHCDCGWQLNRAMELIAEAGTGVILYMKQEGRGIGLANKIRAYALQEKEGLDTVEANERLGFAWDLREYGIGAQILHDCGVGKMKLLTNNPKKMSGLSGFGLTLVEQVPIVMDHMSERQKKYMETKEKKMGHNLHLR
jgi:3,4-dihydroxy 2-butanone 4-phosphate synthase / GTP cyclohydrolase II